MKKKLLQAFVILLRCFKRQFQEFGNRVTYQLFRMWYSCIDFSTQSSWRGVHKKYQAKKRIGTLQFNFEQSITLAYLKKGTLLYGNGAQPVAEIGSAQQYKTLPFPELHPRYGYFLWVFNVKYQISTCGIIVRIFGLLNFYDRRFF